MSRQQKKGKVEETKSPGSVMAVDWTNRVAWQLPGQPKAVRSADGGLVGEGGGSRPPRPHLA